MVSLLPQAASRVGELERPEEIVCFLEMRTNCENLVDQVFNADNVVLAKTFLDKGVICDWDSLFVNFHKATFVDQLANTLQVWVTI